ncbi:hypothetical protein [Desulfitobacterium hafniense]|nr:hypothetical protein [Desulfitobacterium hafniense]
MCEQPLLFIVIAVMPSEIPKRLGISPGIRHKYLLGKTVSIYLVNIMQYNRQQAKTKYEVGFKEMMGADISE